MDLSLHQGEISLPEASSRCSLLSCWLELGTVPTSNQSPAKENGLFWSKKKKWGRITGFSSTEMELSTFYPISLTNYNKNPWRVCIKQASWDSWQVNNTRPIWKGNQILKNDPGGSEFPDFFHSPSSDSRAAWIQGLHSKCRQKKLQERPSLSNQKTKQRGPYGMENVGEGGKSQAGIPQAGSCILRIAWA